MSVSDVHKDALPPEKNIPMVRLVTTFKNTEEATLVNLGLLKVPRSLN